MMNKLKFGFLAVMLMLPTLGTNPPEQATETPQITYEGYYKVMPFEDLFDDQFDVYIFGLATKQEVYNPIGLEIPYNKKVYMKFDNHWKIIDIKTATEMKQLIKNN